MVPSGCFLALVRVLANCDYPCSLIPSIVVTLYMSAYNDTGVREKATYLLQLIVKLVSGTLGLLLKFFGFV